MSHVEISIRLFYTSDEVDLTPKLTIVVPTASLIAVTEAPDWAKLVDTVRAQIAGFPVTNMREMTAAEAKAYRVEEDDEDR